MPWVTFEAISPCVPSTCAHNAIHSLLIIHIIPSRHIYVAIDNPSLVPSFPCLTACGYLWKYLRAADDVSHAENVQSNGSQCFSHLNEFREGIQVTRVLRYCSQHQGNPVLKESFILVLELDFEWSLQLPGDTPIECAITSPQALLHPHLVVPSIPSAPAMASCASIHLRYVFTF